MNAKPQNTYKTKFVTTLPKTSDSIKAALYLLGNKKLLVFTNSNCYVYDFSEEAWHKKSLQTSFSRRFDEFSFYNPYFNEVTSVSDEQVLRIEMANDDWSWETPKHTNTSNLLLYTVCAMTFAMAVANPHVFIVNDTMSVFMFDMKTRTWSDIAASSSYAPITRRMFMIGAAYDRVFQFGGETQSAICSDTNVFHSKQQAWDHCNTRGEADMIPDVCWTVDNNKMLVTGSYRAKPAIRCLDLETMLWKDVYPHDDDTIHVTKLSLDGYVHALPYNGHFVIFDMGKRNVWIAELQFEASFTRFTNKLSKIRNNGSYCDVKLL